MALLINCIIEDTANSIASKDADELIDDTREFVRKSLEDEVAWNRDVIEARLAPHVYLGPAWFLRDPAGWSLLGWYPDGLPRP